MNSKSKFTFIKKVFLLALLLSSVFFYSCNSDDVVDADVVEDYEKLFPWQGIDTPEGAYEDMNIKACNTEELLNEYEDLSKEIEVKRTYVVTVEFSFNEGPFNEGSRYDFRYIDENKQIKAVGTKLTQENISHVLGSGKKYAKTFKVQSGYPMYLFVNGIGNQGSSIKAKISAKSEDGLVVVPILSMEQHQVKRGSFKVENPYCEYIILP